MKKVITIKNTLKTLRVLFILLCILSWSIPFIGLISDSFRLLVTDYVSNSTISNMTDVTGKKLNDGRHVAIMFTVVPMILGLFFFSIVEKISYSLKN